MPVDWAWINAIVQWLVLPMLAVIWTHEKRLNGNDREILRLLTVLEEREKLRAVARENEHETNKRLDHALEMQAEAINKLNDRLDELAKIIVRIQGMEEARK